MTTETRTYVGESGTSATDGRAGFRIGQVYRLRVEHREGSLVVVALDDAHSAAGVGPMVVSQEHFEKWFRR